MAILVACRHGLRASELVALRWDDIDLATARLNVRRAKGGDASVHPIYPRGKAGHCGAYAGAWPGRNAEGRRRSIGKIRCRGLSRRVATGRRSCIDDIAARLHLAPVIHTCAMSSTRYWTIHADGPIRPRSPPIPTPDAPKVKAHASIACQGSPSDRVHEDH
jgi:integrase